MVQDTSPPDPARRLPLAEVLSSLATNAPAGIDGLLVHAAREAWVGVDCLSCARCCRSMSPRFTAGDIKRIALHFRLTTALVKSRWVVQNSDGSWMGRSRPCTFLDTGTNKCTIYAIRPQDCSGFPHLSATPLVYYLDMHRQNLKYCPATFNMVQALQQKLQLSEHQHLGEGNTL